MTLKKIVLAALLFVCLGTLLFGSGPVLAQEKTRQILMVPFAITDAANPECGRLNLSTIPQNLTTRLNRSRVIDVNVTRLFEDNRTQSLTDSVGRLEGLLSDRQLQTLLRTLRNSDYSLLMLGQIKVIGTRKNIISVECQVVDVQTGKIEFFINSHRLCESRFEEALVRELQNQFEINLTQKIRIGLLNFKMTYCDDSTRCPALQEAIPTMLGTGLSISEAITLVEMKEIDQLLTLLTGTNRAREGIYDRNTALEIGHMINVNYLIMGEYWYHDKKMRIDSRCVNIETGEIILSKGINIDNFDVKVVTERINSLATEIRTTIEEDLLAIRKKARASDLPGPQITLSVVCFPPYPQDRSNRLRASQIRKTISSKLRLVEALSIKDDVKKINRYLNQSKDRMQITAELNVNHLLSIEFENYNDMQYLLSADAYDINNPTRTYFKDIQKASSLEVDTMINAIVFNYLKSLNLLTDSLKTEIAGIILPTWLERFSLGFKAGSIRRNDQQVFLNDGIGEYGEVFLNYNLINKLKFEFIFGYDTGKRKHINANTEASIYCLQPGFAIKYNFRESKTINPYAGVGLSALLVPRALKIDKNLTDEAGDIKAGLMAFGGIEFALQGLPISIYLEPRYLIGLPVRSETMRNEFNFKKGLLGGLYILGGVGYNFNY